MRWRKVKHDEGDGHYWRAMTCAGELYVDYAPWLNKDEPWVGGWYPSKDQSDPIRVSYGKTPIVARRRARDYMIRLTEQMRYEFA